MANRYPLIANASAGQIQELAAGDNLDLTSSSIVNAVSIAATSISVTGVATFTNDVNIADNKSLYLGDGNDLRIFSDGTISYIQEQGDGDLYIRGSNKIYIQSTAGESYFVGNSNGAAELYHDNVKKLETTSGGVLVTGTGTTALYVSGDARVTGILTVGSSSITLNGTSNVINVGTGVTIEGNTGIINATTLRIGGQTVSSLGVGIKTEGGTVGTGATILDFRGSGISTVTVSSGIATINITGGGGGSSGGGTAVSISTVAPSSPTDGQQWFDSSDGNTYIWYASQNVWVVSQTYGY